MAKEKIKINLSTAICMVFITILICIIISMLLLFIQFKACEKKYPELFNKTEKVNVVDNKKVNNKKGDNTVNNKIVNNEIINNGENDDAKSIAETINQNSDLPVEYLSKYDKNDKSLEKYDFLSNYMSYDYNNEDISFSYYGYPNDESDFLLGYVEIKTDKYNLLGVKVGEDFEKAIEKIEKYGFTLKKDSYNTLISNDFTITIEINLEDQKKVESISIRAKSDYLGNKIY